MQEHPLEVLQRLIRGFSEDTTQATPLDTATVLEHTGIPSLRQIRPWIRACNAALANERWTVNDAVRETGSGKRRRWHPGRHQLEVYAACQRSILAEAARQPEWTRTRTHSESAGHTYIMRVRALQLHDRILTCPGGPQELARRLDGEPHDPTGPARQGEVHIHDMIWNPAVELPEEPCTTVPMELGLNGLLTRGRGNTPAGLKPLPQQPEPLQAQIATGVWMEREVACENPADELARVAAEEPDWSDWTEALDMPIHRHVEAIVTGDGRSWEPPASLRFRADLMIMVGLGVDQGHLYANRIRHHGETALQRALDKDQRYREEITAIILLGQTPERVPLADSIDPPPTPVPGPAPRAFHDPETGEIELAGGPYTDIGEWAEGCRNRGDVQAAMALLRQTVATMPSDLSALEDLSYCHELLGHRDEALGLRRELIARAEAMLPDNVRWQDSKLPWPQIRNRPFLRALFWLASDFEENDSSQEALAGYRQILSVCPNDNLGVRYCLLRLLLNAGDWAGLRTLLHSLGNDEHQPAVDFARALLAWHDGDRAPFQTAVNRHPLTASRIAQGDRAPTLAWDATEAVGSYAEAERYWTRHHAAWTGADAGKLREAVQAARERSPRTRAIAGFGLAFGNPETAEKHMASYRRALMNLPNINPRLRDEFWDLTWCHENGSAKAELTDMDGTLQVEWYGLVLRLEGHWTASVCKANDPDAAPATVHFDAIRDYIRDAGNR